MKAFQVIILFSLVQIFSSIWYLLQLVENIHVQLLIKVLKVAEIA